MTTEEKHVLKCGVCDQHGQECGADAVDTCQIVDAETMHVTQIVLLCSRHSAALDTGAALIGKSPDGRLWQFALGSHSQTEAQNKTPESGAE